MKLVILTLGLLLTTHAFAEIKELSMTEEEVLMDDILKVQSKTMFEGERMVAGEFEAQPKQEKKKTYMNGLRTRLGGLNSFTRF